MSVNKKDIRALTKDQLRDFFVSEGDKPFRGNQVYEWLWRKSAHSFEDMTNISKETRQMLEANFVINHIEVDTIQKSSDGFLHVLPSFRDCRNSVAKRARHYVAFHAASGC